MPRFVARSIIIEAVQNTGSIAEWPDPFRMAVVRYMPGGTIDVMTGDGARQCRYLDWMVRGPDGQFTVVRDAAFEAMFELHAEPEVAGRRAIPRKELTHGR